MPFTIPYVPTKKHVPERTCVICKKRFAKQDLSRYVLTQTGVLDLDEHKILPGRGWYLCSNSTCVAKFAKFRPKKRIRIKEEGKLCQGAI